MATPEIGYTLRLIVLLETLREEFDESLLKLKKQVYKILILEPKRKWWWILNTAFTLADEFLGDNKMICLHWGWINKKKEDYKATPETLKREV